MTTAERYKYFKEKGICPRCEQRPIQEGLARCTICAKEGRGTNKVKNERQRKEYRHLKAWGLCVRCKKEARPGRTRCEECAEHAKKLQRMKPITMYQRRRKKGLCGCGREPRKGMATCWTCADRWRKRNKR